MEWPKPANVGPELAQTLCCSRQLALVLQFWRGDQAAALDLAKMLTDIEPQTREDVVFVFARRFDLPMSSEIEAAAQYCRAKFPVVPDFQSKRQGTGRPDGCFGLWAGCLELLWEGYIRGEHMCESAFMFEADGLPLTRDWLDRLKRAHVETQQLNKRVTGAICQHRFPHVNGSFIIDLSCWVDHPSLHNCPPGWCWDVFHGKTLLMEAGPSHAIISQYAMGAISELVFRALSLEHAWVSSTRDGSARVFAERLAQEPIR